MEQSFCENKNTAVPHLLLGSQLQSGVVQVVVEAADIRQQKKKNGQFNFNQVYASINSSQVSVLLLHLLLPAGPSPSAVVSGSGPCNNHSHHSF